MKTLITGGAGFVGSWLVQALLERGDEVVVIDNLARGRRESLPTESERMVFCRGDVLDGATLRSVFLSHKFDVVYHLAAHHYIPFCMAHPLETLRLNVEATAALFECCLETSRPRIVFSSTAAVYGPSNAAHAEQGEPAPIEIYGASKAMAEMLATHYARAYGLDIRVARLFNVYGPRDTNPHVIPEFLQQFESRSPVLRVGNLTPERDYVYVEDVADALIGIGMRQELANCCVNIGTGKAHAVAALIEYLVELAGYRPEVVSDPDRTRKVERPFLVAETQQLRKLLPHWSPRGIREGLARTWEYDACARQSAKRE